MNKLEMQIRIKNLKEELEARYQYGIIKMASDDGSPIPTEILQNEMFKLIYKLSKMD